MGETAKPRDALNAYLLGDLLKEAGWALASGGPTAEAHFAEALREAKALIESMSWCEAASRVFESDAGSRRPSTYPEMEWSWEIIDLKECLFWPGYHGTEWARGSVPEVALKVQEPGREGHQAMVVARSWSRVPFSEMPLVAVRLNGCRLPLGLDDGNHRAVASYLVGANVVRVLVGSQHSYYDSEFSCYRGS